MHTLPFHTDKLIRSKYFSQYNHRVCKGSGKPGKAWSFILTVTFSRTGNTCKKTTGPGKSWKSAQLKKYRERCFSSCHERGTKWKFLSPREESNRGRGLRNVFFVPRSWQDEKHLSLFLYRTQNFPSLLFYFQAMQLSEFVRNVCRP